MTSHAITIDVDQATYDKFQETCSNTAMEACESVGYCRIGEASTKKPEHANFERTLKLFYLVRWRHRYESCSRRYLRTERCQMKIGSWSCFKVKKLIRRNCVLDDGEYVSPPWFSILNYLPIKQTFAIHDLLQLSYMLTLFPFIHCTNYAGVFDPFKNSAYWLWSTHMSYLR